MLTLFVIIFTTIYVSISPLEEKFLGRLDTQYISVHQELKPLETIRILKQVNLQDFGIKRWVCETDCKLLTVLSLVAI